MKNKEEFEVKDGEVVTKYAVLRPSAKDNEEAQLIYSKAFAAAAEAGAPVRARIETILRNQGKWTDEMAKEEKEIRLNLGKVERKLKAGGIKKSQGRVLAIELRKLRNRLFEIHIDKNAMDNITAEAIAEDKRFNFLLSRCIVYGDTGEPVFKNLDEYLEAPASEATVRSMGILQTMLYGVDVDFVRKYPENEFLVKYGFADDSLKLVDKDGNPVDEEGNKITSEPEVVEQPFLDD